MRPEAYQREQLLNLPQSYDHRVANVQPAHDWNPTRGFSHGEV